MLRTLVIVAALVPVTVLAVVGLIQSTMGNVRRR
jgi:hypothetical protein